MADCRGGADFLQRIFPPACALIGVLETGATSVVVRTGGGRDTTWAGAPIVNFKAGGPKFGRRRLNPKPTNRIYKIQYAIYKKLLNYYSPEKDGSSSWNDVDCLLLTFVGIRFASRTGVDMDSKACNIRFAEELKTMFEEVLPERELLAFDTAHDDGLA